LHIEDEIDALRSKGNNPSFKKEIYNGGTLSNGTTKLSNKILKFRSSAKT
jgi:hypothetical protein